MRLKNHINDSLWSQKLHVRCMYSLYGEWSDLSLPNVLDIKITFGYMIVEFSYPAGHTRAAGLVHHPAARDREPQSTEWIHPSWHRGHGCMWSSSTLFSIGKSSKIKLITKYFWKKKHHTRHCSDLVVPQLAVRAASCCWISWRQLWTGPATRPAGRDDRTTSWSQTSPSNPCSGTTGKQ